MSTLPNNVREALAAAIDALEDAANVEATNRDWFPVSSQYHAKHKVRAANARRHRQTLERFLAERIK